MTGTKQHRFDAHAREAQLRAEAQAWDTSVVEEARPGEIPVIDLARCFSSDGAQAREATAAEVRQACTASGFFSILGHGVEESLLRDALEAARRFHELPAAVKASLAMDRPGRQVGGVGYLPYANYKLPARDQSNLNESFIIKRNHLISLDDNLWPDERLAPGFRTTVTDYAARMESLARRLLPVFARALDLHEDFFDEAFDAPMFRMRLTRYRPAPDPQARFGIAPHVDTSFFTILAQDSPGLVIFNQPRQRWLRVPMLDNAFVVNSGELLRQWSNDRFLSVRHFVRNPAGGASRHSIPFFFNARPDHVMHCLPSCHGPGNPPKYPPISYLQSQGVVQGE